MKDVMPLTGKEDNIEGVRMLLHHTILHANVARTPKGQALTTASQGTL